MTRITTPSQPDLMTEQQPNPSQPKSSKAKKEKDDPLVRARKEKLQRWRDDYGIDPYGQRVDGLINLTEARGLFDQAAHDAYEEAKQAGKDDPNRSIKDARPRAMVAGRCIQHRAMGKLVFLSLRDHSGDLQISVSKASMEPRQFKIASKLDYGDIVVAEGPVGMTQKGEICIWAERFEVHCKSLAPPPEKYHGLTDPELRYRHRYVDMYVNPEVMRKMLMRSKIVSRIRRYMDDTGSLEVETPMMQPIAGGAAARPFVTHHNALDIDLFLRIAPELYLKRLLVGGMPRVYEINRNFRNEGIDRQHNPEFTMLEVYWAFADYHSMMELTEGLFNVIAREVCGAEKLPFGDHEIDYSLPFRRAKYLDLFAEYNGFDASDHERLVEKAKSMGKETEGRDHDIILHDVWEDTVEHHLTQPTFVMDYPASLCPLTKRKKDDPDIAERFELFMANMELANAYTELNDPEIQEANFRGQVEGLDEEGATFRALDEDFLNALRVGMPPAGGLGIGIDRLIMLMTNTWSIRDVILFPLVKPEA